MGSRDPRLVHTSLYRKWSKQMAAIEQVGDERCPRTSTPSLGPTPSSFRGRVLCCFGRGTTLEGAGERSIYFPNMLAFSNPRTIFKSPRNGKGRWHASAHQVRGSSRLDLCTSSLSFYPEPDECCPGVWHLYSVIVLCCLFPACQAIPVPSLELLSHSQTF